MTTIIELKAQISILETLKTDSSDSNQQVELKARIMDIKLAIAELAMNAPLATAIVENPQAQVLDYKKIQLTTAQVAGIPKFSGTSPDEVSSFITRLKQLKSSCHLDDDEVILHAQGKLSPPAYRSFEQFQAVEGSITTLGEFINFIKKTWGAQLSVFQLLETAFNVTRKTDENWLQYNTRVNINMNKVKIAHSEFVRTPGSTSGVVSADQVFQLFQSAIVLSSINKHSQELYRVLTQEAASLKTPNVLAARAATLETQGHFVGNDVMYSGNHNGRDGNRNSQGKKPHHYHRSKKGTGKSATGPRPDRPSGDNRGNNSFNKVLFAGKDWSQDPKN